MSYRDVSMSFRFLSLMPSERDALQRLCDGVVSRPARGFDGRVTGLVHLRDGVDYSWIKPFIEQNKITDTDFGLFVSISTNSDSEIVRVPQFAVDLVREVGGAIDFSFTVLPDD